MLNYDTPARRLRSLATRLAHSTPGAAMARRRTVALLSGIDAIPENWHNEGTVPSAVVHALARHLAYRRLRHTLETGTGRTTLLFSHLSQDHVVFAVGAPADSISKVRAHPLLNRDCVTFVEGPSQLTLPRYNFKHQLDFAMLDGPHGYPFPDLEYFHIYPHLAPGALLVLDDIHIPTVFNLFAFVREDAMFELLEVVENTAFLRRTESPASSPLGDGWWEQNYNTRRFPIPLDDQPRSIAAER